MSTQINVASAPSDKSSEKNAKETTTTKLNW